MNVYQVELYRGVLTSKAYRHVETYLALNMRAVIDTLEVEFCDMNTEVVSIVKVASAVRILNEPAEKVE